MPVNVICVGKLRERFYAGAAEEYLKRLKRLMPVTVTELPDEPEPAQPSDRANEAVMRREGERILQRIGPQDYVIALCIEGRQYASPELADRLQSLFTQGKSRVDFVIGGSLGLAGEVKNRAQEKFSLSRLTFPHRLARIVLLEQLYRGFKICHGQTYHK